MSSKTSGLEITGKRTQIKYFSIGAYSEAGFLKCIKKIKIQNGLTFLFIKIDD